jgi:mRNA-degrading endonuclease toxin of MazEF toxin-antitoxin module
VAQYLDGGDELVEVHVQHPAGHASVSPLGRARLQPGASTSRLATTVAAVITSSTALPALPGNVFLPAAVSGLPCDSVVNVTALVTLDKADLTSRARRLPASLMDEVDRGLRPIFGL